MSGRYNVGYSFGGHQHIQQAASPQRRFASPQKIAQTKNLEYIRTLEKQVEKERLKRAYVEGKVVRERKAKGLN